MQSNYRLLKRERLGLIPVYAIHRVFYDESGKVKCYTMEPVSPDADSPAELKEILGRMLEGLDEEVLTYENTSSLD